jgi:hypothetical protein
VAARQLLKLIWLYPTLKPLKIAQMMGQDSKKLI